MPQIDYLSESSVNYLRNTKVEIPKEIRKIFIKKLGYGSLRLGLEYSFSHSGQDEEYSYANRHPFLKGKVHIYLVPDQGCNSLRHDYTKLTSEEIEGILVKPNRLDVFVDEAKKIGTNEKFLTKVLKEYLKIKKVVNHD